MVILNMDYALCLFGGCSSPLVATTTPLENGMSGLQFVCKDISKDNYAIAVSRRSLPRGRVRHTSNIVDGNAWIIGGRDENNIVINQIDVYNELKDEWMTLHDGTDAIVLGNGRQLS